MTLCVILGDSIAVGVGQMRPECETTARVGISSGAFVRTLLSAAHRTADSVVISLGVNDDPAAHTLDNLRQMRADLHVRTATWLLPGLKPGVRQAIQTVAAENHDRLVDTRAEAGPDHLHPTAAGYRQIATWTQDGGQHAQEAEGGAGAGPLLPVVIHPGMPAFDPPRWLPMAQLPSMRPTFQQGAHFRLWVPAGGTAMPPRFSPIRLASH